MKRQICIIALLLVSLASYAPAEIPERTGATVIEELFYAICIVESGLDSMAVGRDNDRGIAQITPILELDYFQRTGKRIDPFNTADSWEVFEYYAKRRGPDVEEIARKWNAGGNWKGEQAGKYFEKVKHKLNKLKN